MVTLDLRFIKKNLGLFLKADTEQSKKNMAR